MTWDHTAIEQPTEIDLENSPATNLSFGEVRRAVPGWRIAPPPSPDTERSACAIHGTGAFRNFKDALRRHGIESGWCAFRGETLREIALDWCAENHVLWEQASFQDFPVRMQESIRRNNSRDADLCAKTRGDRVKSPRLALCGRVDYFRLRRHRS